MTILVRTPLTYRGFNIRRMEWALPLVMVQLPLDLLQISRGNIPGASHVNKFGRNIEIDATEKNFEWYGKLYMIIKERLLRKVWRVYGIKRRNK